MTRADEIRERERLADWGPWIPTRLSAIDVAAFKRRYSLTDEQFQLSDLDGLVSVRVKRSIDLGTERLIFEAPPPVIVKTDEDYARELIARLMPGATLEERSQAMDALLRLIGARPRERAPETSPIVR